MRNPYLLGTACGLFSALVYTCANALLRSVHELDPVWVSAVKAVPTVLAMGPILLLQAARGWRVFPSWRTTAGIVAGGLLGQLGGNIAFQWALGQIGIALTVPLSLGGMVLGAAVLGRVFLAEPLPPGVLVALGFLLGAISVLSLGAEEARQSLGVVAARASGWQQIAGVAAACWSGVAYAGLNVILRYCTTRGSSLPSTLFTVALTGLVSLGVLSLARVGPAGIALTTGRQWGLMLGAGICNTIAFVSLTRSLQLTSVVYVNALNATQATLAALAGVVVFREALSPWLAMGVTLTIAGLVCLARSHQQLISLHQTE
jgi:drug/metabolite transporter (DMT)-like permease